MEWRHSGSSTPKNPSAKIRWKSTRLDFLGSRRYPPHGLSSKGPNYQCWVLIISAGANEGYFEGKTAREGHRGCLVLYYNAPAHPALATHNKLAYPFLWIWTSWTTTCSLKGGGRKVPIFRLTWRSLLPRRPVWTDDILIFFFWVACKSVRNGLRNVLSFVGSMLNKSWVWSL